MAKTTKTYKKKSVKKTAKPTVSKAVKTYVKKAIHIEVENKSRQQAQINQNLTTCLSGQTRAHIVLIPQINQGAANGSRIGNIVKVVKAYCDVIVNILPYSLVSNSLSTPVMIKMWLASARRINTRTLSGTLISANFFNTNDSSTGFSGNIVDFLYPINSDNWRIHKTKTFKLGAAYASSTGPVGTSGYFDNSPMIKMVRFSGLEKHIGTLKYNDDASEPQNRNLFIILQAVYADGSTAAVTPAEFHYNTVWEYEDS